MSFEFSLKFKSRLQLASDSPVDLKRQFKILKSAIEKNEQIGLNIYLKTEGAYWSSFFFLNDNLSGVIAISLKDKDIYTNADIKIFIDQLPPKLVKALKQDKYEIGHSGFFIDGEGLIASKGVSVANQLLSIV